LTVPLARRLQKLIISLVAPIANRWLWLNQVVTKIAVNGLVNAGRNRPHPWSTRSPYVSWDSLTDRTYYARLLPADTTFPSSEVVNQRRPSLEQLADLFAAGGPQRLSPKSTCLFPAFAQYLTDGFIRTKLNNDDTLSRRDQTTSNHDIDLSQLYGRTHEQTMALRRNSQVPGLRGRLASQVVNGEEYSPWLFSRATTTIDPKIDPAFSVLDVPLGLDHSTTAAKQTLFACGGDRVNAAPQTAMINTLLLREHNRLAQLIEEAHPDFDDERVFQTTRNVVIVMFIKIVVEEYINHINTTPFRLRALPEVAYRAKWNRPNWITAEFALLYRWHSLVPQKMTWGGIEYDGRETQLNNEPLLRVGLAQSFVDVSSTPATQLGLGNSANFLRQAEMKAIEQGRINLLATYADYRRAMKLRVPATFEELVGATKKDSQKDHDQHARRLALAQRLRELYGTVDNVEFYIGLFAEPVHNNGPLPELINSMVAMDAFSQALTNPLLSEHVWGDPATRATTFTTQGTSAIETTKTLGDMVNRNCPGHLDDVIGMTRKGWTRK
jgi:prostaglandin-endoperoxide synthase 2